MKTKYITVSIIASSIIFFGLNNKKVEAKSAGAPASRTNAPTVFTSTEASCNASGCHNSFPTNSGNGQLTVELVNGWSGYIPGEPTEVRVKITDVGFSKFGFEAVAIREYSDLIKLQAGNMQLTDPLRTQILEADATSGNLAGRQYVTHTFDGNVGANDSNEWTFTWIPSDTLTGDVGIYVTAASANQDQEVTGDYVYQQVLMLSQIPLSIEENKSESVKVYPTLVTDNLTVKANQKTNINIYNLLGEKVYSSTKNNNVHNLQHLNSGQYIYTITTESGVMKTGKIIRK